LNRIAGLILEKIIQFVGHVLLKVKLLNNKTQSYKSPTEMWGFLIFRLWQVKEKFFKKCVIESKLNLRTNR
jgi:hypothetical protein